MEFGQYMWLVMYAYLYNTGGHNFITERDVIDVLYLSCWTSKAWQSFLRIPPSVKNAATAPQNEPKKSIECETLPFRTKKLNLFLVCFVIEI